MDYDLQTLGPRSFEHIAQALATREIGPTVSIFGDGADGGREAEWDGPGTSLGTSPTWTGYGIVQAKQRLHVASPGDNLQWLTGTLKDELKQWAQEDSQRERVPQYILFVTNVRLSAGAGGGKDSIKKSVSEEIGRLQLPVVDFRIWDYDDLRALLDSNSDIRVRYSAFITTGDVVARLMVDLEWSDDQFRRSLFAHACKTFIDDNALNLTQAGAVADQRIHVSDVAIDLPAVSIIDPRSAPDTFFNRSERRGIAATIIDELDQNLAADVDTDGFEILIVGGPGQGKSTITQLLAQIYRASFLESSNLPKPADIAQQLEALGRRRDKLSLPSPRARRWPFRIKLTDYADYLSTNQGGGILEFISLILSKRSPSTIERNQLVKWMSSYPWVIFLDGLDEVPASSNRADVLNSIRDFSIDCKTQAADVQIIATTRPQGYNGEFPHGRLVTFELQLLNTSEALSCAESLVSMRHGSGSATADRVAGRLAKSAADETTARLFQSPLQVAILTILLEKLGHAPRERWRLFSQYYKVIVQREQEKGGELAELLQTHEHDVDFLHRHVGKILQERSAQAGDTSAALAKSEFIELINVRLRDQGHNEEEASRLTKSFGELVTDRLVFLVYTSADRVAFEIRSLQEFNAAEAMLSLPESKIVTELESISANAFWRNVALFVAGGIFATREALHAELILLCQALNEVPFLPGHMNCSMPGSGFAAEIIQDGCCAAQPRNLRLLTRTALQGCRARDYNVVRLLSGSRNKIVKEETFTYLEDAATRSGVELMGQIDLIELLHLADPDNDWLKNKLDEIITENAGSPWISLIAGVAIEGSPLLEERLQRHLKSVNIVESMSIASAGLRRDRGTVVEEDPGPETSEHQSWSSALREVLNPFPRGVEIGLVAHPETEPTPGTSINITIQSISSNAAEWAYLSELDFDGARGGRFFKAMASFTQNFSPTDLQEVLLSVASLPISRRGFGGVFPWVVAASIETAFTIVDEFEADTCVSVELERLSDWASSGELGTSDMWSAIEQYFESQRHLDLSDGITLFDSVFLEGASSAKVSNFASGHAATLLPLLGSSSAVSSSITSDQLPQALEILEVIVNSDARNSVRSSAVARLVSFVLSIIMRSVSERESQDIDSDYPASLTRLGKFISHLRMSEFKLCRGPVVWPMIPLRDGVDLNEDDVWYLISEMSSARMYISNVWAADYAEFLEGVDPDGDRDRYALLYGLRVVLDPNWARSVERSVVESNFTSDDNRIFVDAWAVSNLSKAEDVNTDIEQAVQRLLASERFGLDWLARCAEELPADVTIVLYNRLFGMLAQLPETMNDAIRALSLLAKVVGSVSPEQISEWRRE